MKWLIGDVALSILRREAERASPGKLFRWRLDEIQEAVAGRIWRRLQ